MPESLGRRFEMMENGKALADDIDRALGDITRTERPDFDFDQRSGAREVMESLGVMNLEGFGIDPGPCWSGPGWGSIGLCSGCTERKTG